MIDLYGVVVSFNSAAELTDCLPSLAGIEHLAVTVVDNDSTDTSVRIAERGSTTVIRSRTNVGFGAAVNLALHDRPPGADVLLVNPDCTVDNACVASMRARLLDDPRLGIVAPVMRYPNGTNGISGGSRPLVSKEWVAATGVDRLLPRKAARAVLRRFESRLPLGLDQYLGAAQDGGIHYTAWASGFCLLVRGAVIDDIVGFDERFFMYFEDVDFCLRAGEHGWRVAVDGASAALHAESSSSQRVGKSRLYFDGLLTFARAHKGRLAIGAARTLRWVMT